jgi:hypothetical protein
MNMNYQGFRKAETEQKPFNFDMQLKHSFLEVLDRSNDATLNNSRLFSMASSLGGPGKEYLAMKRNSVF